ncbi:MAG: hypothetical protein AAF790_02215 [Planctomycetota bacterium]
MRAWYSAVVAAALALAFGSCADEQTATRGGALPRHEQATVGRAAWAAAARDEAPGVNAVATTERQPVAPATQPAAGVGAPAPIAAPDLAGLDIEAQGELPALAPLPQRPPAGTRPLPGAWFGVYYSYPEFVGVALSIETGARYGGLADPLTAGPDERSKWLQDRQPVPPHQQRTDAALQATGVAKFYRLRSPDAARGGRGRQEADAVEIAECRLRGWYDPVLQTFRLERAVWNSIDTRRFKPQTEVLIYGVWADRLARLGGWVAFGERGPSASFVATSSPEQTAELKRRAIAAMQTRDPEQAGQAELTRRRQLRGRNNAPIATQAEVDAISSWVELYRREMPLERRDRFKMGDHMIGGLSLYAGDEFTRRFGTAFDDLDLKQRYVWQRVAQEMRSPKHYGSEVAARMRDWTGINMFKSGMPGWASTVAGVWTHRVVGDWLGAQLERARLGATHRESFTDATRLANLCRTHLVSYFASEQRAWREEIDTLRARRANATLATFSTDQQAASPDQLELLVASADSGVVAAYQGRRRHDARRRQLGRLRVDFAQVTALADEYPSLASLARWRRAIQQHYGDIAATETYRAVQSYILARHTRLLTAHAGRICQELNGAGPDEINALRGWLLVDASQRQLPAGRRVAEAIAANVDRVARELRLAYFSEQEKQWMEPGTTRIRIPTEVVEPTDDSIRMALLREMALLPSCKRLGPDRVEYSIPGINLLGIAVEVRVASVTKWADPQGRTARDEGAGFRCFYRKNFSSTPVGNLAKLMNDGSPQARFLKGLNSIGEAQAGVAPVSDLFVLTAEGWRSPTIRRRGFKSIANAYESIGQAAADMDFGDWVPLPGGGRGMRVRRLRQGRKVFLQYQQQ